MITLTKKPKTVLRMILAGIKLDVKGLCVQLQVRTFGVRRGGAQTTSLTPVR